MARSVSFCAGFYTAVGSYPYIRRGDLQEYIRIFPTPALPPFTINDITFHGTHGLPRQTHRKLHSPIYSSLQRETDKFNFGTLGPPSQPAAKAASQAARPARQPGQPGSQPSQAARPAGSPKRLLEPWEPKNAKCI